MSGKKSVKVEKVVPEEQEQQPLLNEATLSALDDIERELGEGEAENEQLAQAVAGADQEAADRKQQQVAEQNAALMTAAGAVAITEKALQIRWDFVEIKDKATLVQALAPVFQKHGGGMPGWLLPYQEEFRAAVAVGGAAVGVYLQVKAHESQGETAKSPAKSDEQAEPPEAPAPAVSEPAKPAAQEAGLLDLAEQMEGDAPIGDKPAGDLVGLSHLMGGA